MPFWSVKMPFNTAHEVANDPARKKIRVRETKTNSNTMQIACIGALCVFPSFFINSFSRIRTKPFKPPQKANVQFAPCHKPPKNIVRKRLRYCLGFPLRFPPSGIYKYSLSHVDRLICCRRQNSVRFWEIKDILKLRLKS